MNIKLGKDIYCFLLDNVIRNSEELIKYDCVNEDNAYVYICISEKYADIIRDIAIEKLQIIGFDKDYNLNENGFFLEAIIDAFFLDN